MKVLLLYPNLYGMNMLPPAIGIFTAILKREGHDVALFDTTSYEGLSSIDSDKSKADNLNARPYDDSLLKSGVKHSDPVRDFHDLVAGFRPDLVALSLTEDMYPIGVRLLSTLGADRPKTVAGGVFPTFEPELALKYSNGTIDFIVKGEGEEVLPELCRRLARGNSLDDLDGLYAVIGNTLVNNPLPPPVSLTKVPLPDYGLFEETRFYRPMQGMLRRMLPIETIRGCPYTCAYCNSPAQRAIYKKDHHTFFRKQLISRIRDEILHCINRYKADSFYFWADTFLAWNNLEFEEFCEMYADFKLPFWIQTRPETVREDRFKKLRDVGLLRVAFGIEHGNEGFRQRVLKRRVSNDEIIRSLQVVTDLGIPISVNNIIGFPEETRALAFDTIELNRHFKSDGINAYSYVPFHGTPLRKVAEDFGYVGDGELTRCITEPTMLSMPQFSRDEIEGIRRCFVLYVKMPKSKWPLIEKAEALTPEGDALFRELKKECMRNYMHYGDYEKEDDLDSLDFADAGVISS